MPSSDSKVVTLKLISSCNQLHVYVTQVNIKKINVSSCITKVDALEGVCYNKQLCIIRNTCMLHMCKMKVLYRANSHTMLFWCAADETSMHWSTADPRPVLTLDGLRVCVEDIYIILSNERCTCITVSIIHGMMMHKILVVSCAMKVLNFCLHAWIKMKEISFQSELQLQVSSVHALHSYIQCLLQCRLMTHAMNTWL